jgi:hypothetical protein
MNLILMSLGTGFAGAAGAAVARANPAACIMSHPVVISWQYVLFYSVALGLVLTGAQMWREEVGSWSYLVAWVLLTHSYLIGQVLQRRSSTPRGI